MRRALTIAPLLALTMARPSSALDKQGSAHGGSVDGESDDGFNVAGSAMLGVSLYNATYGARPDNSGLTLFRYAAHADIDLIGAKLSIPLDVNVFTDRQRGGALIFGPTELDVIGGVTSTWKLALGGIEVGTRFEHDRPVDTGSFTQTYVDARARYLYSFAEMFSSLNGSGTDVTGWFTLGAFLVNPTYAARPDNTGKALLRYGIHSELSVFDDLIAVGLDGTMFTDRETSALAVSELDLTPEVILHVAPWEFHVAYERDMPVDRGDFVQSYVYALAVWSFDLKQGANKPLEGRGQVLSP